MPNTSFKELLAPWFDGAPEQRITGLALDNRQIQQGDVFIAVQGHSLDARRFIADAIRAGAVAVISDDGDTSGQFGLTLHDNVPVVAFPHLKSSLSDIAARFYQAPSQHMTTIGVTGTNGKTTVSQLIAQWIDLMQGRAAVMGTTGNGFLDALEPALNTTGSALDIQQQLAAFNVAGATHVAMEVSSHGLIQDRVKAVDFDAAIFTNLSRDHLDYHGTMEAYAEAKLRLFTHYGSPVSVINADDDVGAQWLGSMPEAIAVSMSEEGVVSHQGRKLWLTAVSYATSGVTIAFSSDWGDGEFTAPLVGEFNVMNLLLSLTTLLGLGYDKSALLDVAPQLQAVIGRMEVFHRADKPMLVVDYAHTPDALEKALTALRRHCEGALWCIFGCGGDRDTGKRPMMASIAETLADKAILTDDNPRSESPYIIVSDMLAGMAAPDNAIVLHDRADACRYAFEHAAPSDVILVAGKGHEDYQVLASGTIDYSDRDTVRMLLEGEQ
ncbi:UDP-N-acetylmuramoyl-L-alanyl-D-glutamate--2,6-diaminopimelate ligase [Enterovibrio norvegicus]|uniref:UDP-N-acetylmuramoyl-L-alanyl-D-glutamate--2, 6-diaminopimelate ligase n=1 Tax=Enterovibrio norvegicus TaxID=188144 RepID=UPI000C83D97F|nr:UDP-N-acetylmuramoyl-L-alanyl-D-glutamate--2,6-diaminopimelate ligase [Enterovibrio norvegicus]MCC4799569.1 UDP-N-acetylmuramoyl-L-alanyl-D-glutamate--2,6-diaminopimelate ligase [Enterovibrio norvegicus]PMI31641.1 UDP-N-acetylmuramoyl-L-alanyl-D-glutamate--2,6-diaminopimelate ligase [Enterovibrio norvegicus]PMI37231.1 UDP-N-acetylmuramoyl-L-alanyl-D-glutamate--2,6-diaminopimelate ligase [Enterovibrio norvegicus]PMN50282.1 UDP-N-acetylmuramoyl-L-alanyl-D-glutamate--2,6-diaminopimelate ligase 